MMKETILSSMIFISTSSAVFAKFGGYTGTSLGINTFGQYKLIEKKFNSNTKETRGLTLGILPKPISYSVIEAEALKEKLQLKPHPEGGFYKQNYVSNDKIKSTDVTKYNNETRQAGSAIYFMLIKNDFSAWHCLKSDEMWHHYQGSPVWIYTINKVGHCNKQLLGPLNIEGASPQVLIRAGDWFAAENQDQSSFSFVGCTVTPGFEFRDFILGKRAELIKLYPVNKNIIARLTRS